MTATTAVQSGGHYSATALSELARRHLWMHFTRIGTDPHAPVPIIVSGEGCYVCDADGKRYLDGLSALYCVNAGHGRPEFAQAAAAQLLELDFYTTWSYAHPRAIELATRIAALAPGDLNRVFFTSGGSEAVEVATTVGVVDVAAVAGDDDRDGCVQAAKVAEVVPRLCT